jgi:hypothetical protein
MKCRAVPHQRKSKNGAEFLVAMIRSFRAPLCEEEAIAETTLGPRCARHLEEFKAAMADPNTLGNVLAAKGHEPRGRTPKEIDAMIRFIQ